VKKRSELRYGPLRQGYLWTLIIFIFCTIGCGYHLLDPGPQTSTPIFISVEPIKNKTQYPELDWRVTDAVVMELNNWALIKISKEERADYILSGEILSYRSQIPYTYDIAQNPVEYKLIVEMGFSWIEKPEIFDGEGQETVRKSKLIPHLIEEEIYRVYSSDLGETKRAEWHALELSIKRITRRAMDQFLGIGISCY
jgi:hypothetical protein